LSAEAPPAPRPSPLALRLNPNERILIIAPHPDDEVLACGGLIQKALALGSVVWIVYVTSGDGSWPAAWRVTGKMLPGPGDYLRLGRARIEEARAGARVLDLDPGQLIFLGYPDHGLARLRKQNWTTPYRSVYTRLDACPYGDTSHAYTGEQLLSDLVSVFGDIKPTRVFAPHARDAHADHRSTAALVTMAGGIGRKTAGGVSPELYSYLIRRLPFPRSDTDKSGRLSPPAGLVGPRHHWFALGLESTELRTKKSALRCHRSQRGAFGLDPGACVSTSELFDRPDS
jgi:LmbE family N-acetylglucosaminyl deacetylase